MLRMQNVYTRYGNIEALSDISLEVKSGEIVTLIGANGAGKTTLLMSICGTPRVAKGKIFFKNDEITFWPTHKIIKNGIAVSPEGRRVFPTLTVMENLQMGGFHVEKDALEASIDHVFKLFPRLKDRAEQKAGTMSGGEQQMLAIGRALISRPRLLLLDEPTLGLAPLIIAQIFDIIRTIRDEGITIFLVEQNAHKALHIADRGYVIENGRIVLTDSGKNLLINDDVQKAYLGG